MFRSLRGYLGRSDRSHTLRTVWQRAACSPSKLTHRDRWAAPALVLSRTRESCEVAHGMATTETAYFPHQSTPEFAIGSRLDPLQPLRLGHFRSAGCGNRGCDRNCRWSKKPSTRQALLPYLKTQQSEYGYSHQADSPDTICAVCHQDPLAAKG